MTYNKQDFDKEKYDKAMDVYVKTLFNGKDIPSLIDVETKEELARPVSQTPAPVKEREADGDLL